MKIYTVTSPSLEGILSDDHLFFEGVQRPQNLYQIKDEDSLHRVENIEILEKYFNDIYNLFLRKLSFFVTEESTTNEESTKLQALLQEMIKVKSLIESATRNADERTLD
ncbi:MAG: hypothetical protein AAB917_01940 [Patescibacteria group bacterium]